MIHLHTSGHVELLAARLAEVLAERPADPMTPEWVAVPSDGMRRWLPLELARHLGTSGPTAGDGVAANFTFPFPGSLRVEVLNADRDASASDPWQVDRLVWTVLGTIARHRNDPALAALAQLPPGASLYSKARRVADVFDRYHVHRPAMVLAWSNGRDVDGVGRQLPEHHAWQPHLWRLVRREVDEPSPPERLPAQLDRLAQGLLTVGLPERISVFGLTVLPGGAGFLELTRTVAAHRDVHLFLLAPSPLGTELLANDEPWATGGGQRLRSEDRSAASVHHPLLQSWGRLQRETSLLLAAAQESGFPPAHRLDQPTPAVPPSSVLTQLQSDIQQNRPPSGTATGATTDASVRFHACHGPTRQVEVLRDSILHLLADEELGLGEDDILVACPALDRFAPLIEGVFGPSADRRSMNGSDGGGPASDAGAPALRYRIADRSVRDFNAVLSATSDLIALVSGRFEVSAVLDFLSLEPVRTHAGFTDDDLAQIGEWAGQGQVRWGLTPEHRSEFGLPVSIDTNTWRFVLDRLLLGSAIFDGAAGLALGDTAVIGVEGADVDIVGRVAELLGRLTDLAEAALDPRPINEWVELIRQSALAMFDMPAELMWQMSALWSLLDDVVQSVPADSELGDTPLEFRDLRRVFGDRLRSTPGRPDFFRGGITLTSLTPLRGIPFRVVCLLGMDESAFGAVNGDGDDLAALHPVLGDPDRRAEDRLSLLELVMAAGERLVVVRDGHDVRTNHQVPPAVVVEELREALVATVSDESRPGFAEALETHHPRQAFDERCFIPGLIIRDSPWGFDRGDMAGAEARRHRPANELPFLAGPLAAKVDTVIELSGLHRFLQNPTGSFIERRLGVRLPRRNEALNDDLPIDPSGLEKWKIADRLLSDLLNDVEINEWARIERRLGTLPPSLLGDALIVEVSHAVSDLVGAAEERGLERGGGKDHVIDLALPDGTRLVGSVRGQLVAPWRGPVRVTYSSEKPSHRVAAWLDLMALAAMEGPDGCRSLAVSRITNKPPRTVDLVPAPEGVDGRLNATEALEVIVDCFRRGVREPIPLFPTLSYKVHIGKGGPADWNEGFGGRSDGDDPATRLAFGDYGYRALMALPARDDDPPGLEGGRVKRFADYLYGAMEHSVVDLADMSAGATG
jgi:exodeoxyribonuclease V gamma subunit